MRDIVARIIVKGDVQGVGYRASVKYIAKKMGIKGFVRNLGDGTWRYAVNPAGKVLRDSLRQ